MVNNLYMLSKGQKGLSNPELMDNPFRFMIYLISINRDVFVDILATDQSVVEQVSQT